MLEKKGYVSVSKGVHKQKLQPAKVFVTCKNVILLSKKNVVLLVDAMDGDLTYKDQMKLTLSCPNCFH